MANIFIFFRVTVENKKCKILMKATDLSFSCNAFYGMFKKSKVAMLSSRSFMVKSFTHCL